jgi:hypothetical protein
MRPEPSIFDESFDNPLKVRRWSLVPGLLKFYIIAGLLWGLIVLIVGIIGFIAQVRFLYNLTQHNIYTSLFYMLPRMDVIFRGIIIILMAVLLLMEAKWAILFSYGAGALWLIFAAYGLITGGGYSIRLPIYVIIMFPYYSMLYNIRKRWEENGVNKTQAKAYQRSIKK